MGFRNGGYATVWSVESTRPNVTKVRLSTSRKNKQTGEYEQDFSGFCNFVGNCAVDLSTSGAALAKIVFVFQMPSCGSPSGIPQIPNGLITNGLSAQ